MYTSYCTFNVSLKCFLSCVYFVTQKRLLNKICVTFEKFQSLIRHRVCQQKQTMINFFLKLFQFKLLNCYNLFRNKNKSNKLLVPS